MWEWLNVMKSIKNIDLVDKNNVIFLETIEDKLKEVEKDYEWFILKKYGFEL